MYIVRCLSRCEIWTPIGKACQGLRDSKLDAFDNSVFVLAFTERALCRYKTAKIGQEHFLSVEDVWVFFHTHVCLYVYLSTSQQTTILPSTWSQLVVTARLQHDVMDTLHQQNSVEFNANTLWLAICHKLGNTASVRPKHHFRLTPCSMAKQSAPSKLWTVQNTEKVSSSSERGTGKNFFLG